MAQYRCMYLTLLCMKHTPSFRHQPPPRPPCSQCTSEPRAGQSNKTPQDKFYTPTILARPQSIWFRRPSTQSKRRETCSKARKTARSSAVCLEKCRENGKRTRGSNRRRPWHSTRWKIRQTCTVGTRCAWPQSRNQENTASTRSIPCLELCTSQLYTRRNCGCRNRKRTRPDHTGKRTKTQTMKRNSNHNRNNVNKAHN